MKMECTEQTNIGDNIDISFDIRGQSEIDSGKMPTIVVDLINFDYSQDDIDDLRSGGVFSVDVYKLITEGIRNPDDAEVYADWLESWAEDIRKQFNQPSAE